jgi:hypothetical protein
MIKPDLVILNSLYSAKIACIELTGEKKITKSDWLPVCYVTVIFKFLQQLPLSCLRQEIMSSVSGNISAAFL